MRLQHLDALRQLFLGLPRYLLLKRLHSSFKGINVASHGQRPVERNQKEPSRQKHRRNSKDTLHRLFPPHEYTLPTPPAFYQRQAILNGCYTVIVIVAVPVQQAKARPSVTIWNGLHCDVLMVASLAHVPVIVSRNAPFVHVKVMVVDPPQFVKVPTHADPFQVIATTVGKHSHPGVFCANVAWIVNGIGCGQQPVRTPDGLELLWLLNGQFAMQVILSGNGPPTIWEPAGLSVQRYAGGPPGLTLTQ